jgi:4-amino-4-deoxy-L-arabinose transferase-like glycosyltransferase
LVALSMFAWGSRLLSEKLGLWAAIIFTVSLQTFLHAKAAVADMWLVLFMTLASWSGYELLTKKQTSNPQWKWWCIFYLSLGLAFLAKGPIGWLPLLAIAVMKFIDRESVSAKHFRFVRGILLMLAIVCLWGVPALVRTNGEFFKVGIMHHVVDRSFNAMEGHGSNSLGLYFLLLPFYFVTIFLSFFPWSIKLPRLVAKLRRNRDYIDNYLVVGIALVFIVFTLVKTKLPHYTLPALPLLSLLLARMLIADGANDFLRNCAVAWSVVFFAIAFTIPPCIARLFPAYALFQQSRDQLTPQMQFAASDYSEPSLVWYFRDRAKGFLTTQKPGASTRFMAQEGPRFVIIPTSQVEGLFSDRPSNWKLFSTQGFNLAKGKQIDLTLILKPE